MAFALTNLLSRVECTSGDTWTEIGEQCESDAAALVRFTAFTELHCTMKASDAFPFGILVAQFEPASLRCSLFRYQSVCRDLLSGVSSSDCRVLIRFAIKYPPTQLSPKLTNVWLGDDMTRFENAVCQADEDTNRVHPVGVEWTEEGGVFDGIRSHLVVNKSDIGFGEGMTVLVRLKRQPQVQPFFEFLDCANFATSPFYHHIWEHDAVSRFYITYISLGVRRRYMTSALLPANESEWINLGFSANASAGSWGVYFNGSFVPPSLVTVTNTANSAPPLTGCFCFGRRRNHGVLFKGVVKAIAIGSSFIMDSEIQEFFAAVP